MNFSLRIIEVIWKLVVHAHAAGAPPYELDGVVRAVRNHDGVDEELEPIEKVLTSSLHKKIINNIHLFSIVLLNMFRTLIDSMHDQKQGLPGS